MAETAKKQRSIKARRVTRRVNELLNGIKTFIAKAEITEKINNVKYVVDELGELQDDYMGYLDTNNTELLNAEQVWYDEYDLKANLAIKEARKYISERETPLPWPTNQSPKLKKLEIPKFESEPKDFFQWKEKFERFTASLDEESKYDYLFVSTTGKAHHYVANKGSYGEAMEKLKEIYGNIHAILGILIEEIKALPIVRKGDFKAFEQLTFQVNDFHDRLKLMGLEREAENSYILKEIECKLNQEDSQKWLESLGNRIDTRRVDDLLHWLEVQTKLRRISNISFSYSNYRRDGNNTSNYNSRHRPSNNINTATNAYCAICNENAHEVRSCPKFISSPIDEKWIIVRKLRLCFQCLGENHYRDKCVAPKCQYCSRTHDSMLHNSFQQVPNEWNNKDINEHNSNTISLEKMGKPREEQPCHRGAPPRSYLPIVRATVINKERRVNVITILDSGSELNVINTRLCNKLGLSGTPITINIIGIAGNTIQRYTKIVDVIVEDRMGLLTPVQCIVLDKTCGNALMINRNVFASFGDIKVPEKEIVTRGGEVELLIGMNCPRLHQQISLYGKHNSLMIMETRFGPTVVGRAPENYPGNYECGIFNVCRMSLNHEENNLWKIAEAETAGIKAECECKKKTDEEILFENCMKDAWSIDEEGRFEVRLPWKMEPQFLENNRLQVLKRSEALEKRLAKNPKVLELFNEQVDEMVTTGVLRKTAPDYPKRYIPLIAVVDLHRESTKVRVCLDSKSKFFGFSLNDTLLKGKHVMSDILQIVRRFRSGKYTLIGDISKMFWQIKITEKDQLYHGVIYKGESYVFTRVCFGNKPSPPIAEMGMVRVAEHGKFSHPHASQALLFKRFMDDILDSNSKIEVLRTTRNEMDGLIGKFGFNIKEWYSNDKERGMNLKSKKILGIQYNTETDNLVAGIEQIKELRVTKRRILSRIAEIWDPLGITAGVCLTGKLLFQSITRLNYNWDTLIENEEVINAWKKWNQEMENCKDLLVARSILPSQQYEKECLSCEIIGFSDGSNVGYGCVNYLKWKNADQSIIDIKFLCAKAKVAPIKGNTIPRNELCGALNLARLTWSLIASLEKTEDFRNISTGQSKLFSDSTTILSWVNSPAINYKPYVKNKVIEIQNLVPSSTWGYIPSNKNKSADLLSKGCGRKELEIIINGPDILKVPERDWPTLPENRKIDESNELRVETKLTIATFSQPLAEVCKYSSWRKLIRITGYIIRFVNKIRKDKAVKETEYDYYGNLSKHEIASAEKYWFKYAQQEIREENKFLEKYTPFEDEHGLKRISGRLGQSEIFDYDRKHPILLPFSNPISKLIMLDLHEKLLHPGHTRVLAESRNKYWIVNGRRLAKSIGHNCITCRRWRGKELNQLMSDLPKNRIQHGCAPFENTCIDYSGPSYIKFGRRQRIKCYGIVFTCLTTRAVYLDLATDLSIDKFLLALRRFISTYGTPKNIHSDNGSNFKGAARELSQMINRWKRNNPEHIELKEFLASYNIKWTFGTPLAPHHNGVVESIVKSVKGALNKVIKDIVVSEEEYRTILLEIQDLINSRPLWPHNDGDIDEPPICCNDLLRPRGLLTQPQKLNNGSPRTRYEYIQKVVNEWWKVWLRNFVPSLQIRSKWWKTRENVNIGDIVLLVDPNIKRGRWQMGIITDTYPGKDNRIRSVKVKTSTGCYDRPITKLSLLLTKEEYENGEE